MPSHNFLAGPSPVPVPMHHPLDDRTLVNGWLRQLGTQARMSLQLDDQGLCGIGHASGVDCVVEVPDRSGRLYLWSPLLPWPGLHPQLIAERCLGAHFLGAQTGGASFALHPSGTELMFWQIHPIASLDESRFATAVIEFIQQAAQWRDNLQRLDLRPPADLVPRPMADTELEAAGIQRI